MGTKNTNLGRVDVKEASLPSSESAKALLNGEPGGWWKFTSSTILRSILIAPGLIIGGVRKPSQILVGSLASSMLISTFIITYLAFDNEEEKVPKTRRRASSPTPPTRRGKFAKGTE